MRKLLQPVFNAGRGGWFILGLALASSFPTPISAASTAYLLDIAGVRNNEELYLVGALQGLVNRDAPRLFKSNYEGSQTSGAGRKWAEYLHAEKGITWVTLPSLNDAINTFKGMQGSDGQPLLKGLIKYQPTYWDGHATVDKGYEYWIAGNYAAQENLLPVTDDILANHTELLSGGNSWYTDTAMTGWRQSFADAVITADGLRVSASTVDSKTINMEAYYYKWMNIDLDATPKIEITVSALSAGGKWGFAIDLGSTVDLNGNRGTVPVYKDKTDTGTFTFDLKKSGLFNPLKGRASLQICAMTPHGSVTVKRIRFLDADGNVPTAKFYSPPQDEFIGLTVQRDLTDLNANPQMADENQARTWSLQHQLPLCDKNSAFLAYPEYPALNGIDWAIADKSYLYFDHKTPYQDPTPDLDYLLGKLNPTARLGGSIGTSEDWMILKYSSFGHRQVALPANFSFWKNIPAEGIKLPLNRHVTSLEPKFYINFTQASGDVIDQPAGFVNGWWFDPVRGTMPTSWGFNSALAEVSPAFVEYFAKTASKLDDFFTGPSGSGYTQYSAMGAAKMAAFAHITRKDIQELGMSPVIDDWDAASGDLVHQAFTQTETDSAAPLQMLIPLPRDHGPAFNHWMDDGTPVIFPDQTLAGLWSNDGKSTADDLASRLKAVAATHPEGGPFFLSCNIRFSPAFYKQVMAQLDPAMFQVVGMPDFIGLAQEAGAFQAKPYADGVGAGDTLQVSLELHNAGGTTGGAGTITWALPPDWSAKETQWNHGAVPIKGVLKHAVTFTASKAPNNTSNAKLVFTDSRFKRNQAILITTYQQGHTVTDGSTLAGWTGSGGASVKMENGMVKILPAQSRTRNDAENAHYVTHIPLANNGRVLCNLGPVDFSRHPVLEINIPDAYSNNSDIGLVDSAGRYQRLSAVHLDGVYKMDMSGWSGVRTMQLAIDPVTSFGEYLFVRSVKIFDHPMVLIGSIPKLPKIADYSIKKLMGTGIYQIMIRNDGMHKVEIIKPNGVIVATFANSGLAMYNWRAPAPGLYLVRLTIGNAKRLIPLLAFD